MAPSSESSRLVLTGGAADLSFRDGTGAKRRVVKGAPFEVDAATAAILLTDPWVQPWAEPEASARNDADPESTDPRARLLHLSVAQLSAYAGEIGLTPRRVTKPVLVDMILTELDRAAEEQRLADEAAATAAAASSSGEGNQGGSATPADDPGAPAPGEAGTPPATDPGTSGAIVLGDLPPSAKLGA